MSGNDKLIKTLKNLSKPFLSFQHVQLPTCSASSKECKNGNKYSTPTHTLQLVASFTTIRNYYLFCVTTIPNYYLFCVTTISNYYLFCVTTIPNYYLFCVTTIPNYYLFCVTTISNYYLFCVTTIPNYYLFCVTTIPISFTSVQNCVSNKSST